MRSAREIQFRLWQQVENARLTAFPPVLSKNAKVAALPLPDPILVAASLKDTPYAAEIVTLADEILHHRIPLFGITVETGPTIEWRKDYVNGQVTGTGWARSIPYLDFAVAGDHKVVWELNRHQHLVVLAQAWLLSGNAAYLTEIEAQLESWFAQNPFQRGINFTSALEVAFRALSWLWIDHLAGPKLQPELRRKLWNGLYQHGFFLAANLSTYFSPNTHLLGEGVALHALGLKFPDTPWERQGNRVAEEELARQVRPDGSHFEQSTYYHVYALDFFVFYYLLAGRPASFAAPLLRMAEFLEAVTGPAGQLTCFGDDDGGRLFHPYGQRAKFGRASLTTCRRLFGNIAAGIEDMPQQSAWWVGPGSFAPQAPQDHAVHFPDSGLISVARGPLHLLIDGGPFGPGGAGHSHSDTLSLTVRFGELQVLIDPGTYTYVADPKAREEFRGSGYHNTIRVDGLSQAVPVRPFRWENLPLAGPASLRHEGEAIHIDTRCAYRGIVHRRRFVLHGEVLFILDQLTGPEGVHAFEQFWHFGPAAEGSCTLLSSIGREPVQEEGWRSPCLGSRVRAPVTVYRWDGSFPVSVGSALVFSRLLSGSHRDLRLTLDQEGDSIQLAIPGVAAAAFL